MAWCGNCKEEFSPVENASDDPPLCSYECEDELAETEKYQEIYDLVWIEGAAGI